ncbi:MAG: CoA pyrophosphatase [Chloroflexi bacterium]|nr:CoA pyrophosphatase [Chloroflexota bacterium]
MPAAIAETVRIALSKTSKSPIVDTSLTPAGVMLLVYRKDGMPWVLLSRRSQMLTRHSGEIAFPGGREEKSDRDLKETALRETFEEIGIRPEHVEVLGELDDVQTPTNFVISPFVGVFPYPYKFRLNGEVSELIEVPIPALVDEANVRADMRIVDGEPMRIPSYSYEGQLIYGATARVLEQFLRVVTQPSDGHGLWRN